MLAKILARLSEPSTYAGLAAVTVGVGQVAKIEEAPEIARVVADAAAAVGIAGPWGALAAIGLGVASIFMREKGKR